MYYRKAEEKRRLRRLHEETRRYWPAGAYEKDGKFLKRLWKSTGKSSVWAIFKRHARRKARRVANATGVYDRRYYDLWWSVW